MSVSSHLPLHNSGDLRVRVETRLRESREEDEPWLFVSCFSRYAGMPVCRYACLPPQGLPLKEKSRAHCTPPGNSSWLRHETGHSTRPCKRKSTKWEALPEPSIAGILEHRIQGHDPDGIGFHGNRVSGNLLVLDLDLRADFRHITNGYPRSAASSSCFSGTVIPRKHRLRLPLTAGAWYRCFNPTTGTESRNRKSAKIRGSRSRSRSA